MKPEKVHGRSKKISNWCALLGCLETDVGTLLQRFQVWRWRETIRGLNRTGKSCRLRWVNYLQPGLKREKMSPQEEKLVLDLHSKWGNRWSRIASKLPGRTDNEIKNYWRTYMRKKAQQKKCTLFKMSSSSSSASSNDPKVDSLPSQEIGEESFYDTGGSATSTTSEASRSKDDKDNIEEEQSMDDIWREIALSGNSTITPANNRYNNEEGYSFFSPWKMNDDQLLYGYDQYGTTTTCFSG